MKNTFLLISATLWITACAKQPESIPAVEVGANEFQGLSCEQLSQARVTTAQNLENLSAAQKSAATGDAVGVFLLGLPVSSMSGNDNETAIAVTKGRMQALDREIAQKDC